MTSRTRQLALAILCCGLVLAPEVWAFFPVGVYDSTGVLRIKKYNRSHFDNNNDGEIDEEEGIPVYIEDGKRGFTDDEVEIVREALQVWERIPQSYAATSVVGTIQDPILTGQDDFDTLNVIAIQVTGTQDLDGDGLPDENVEPDTVLVPDLSDTVAGITITFWATEESAIQSGTETYLVGAGSIIDNDIIINGNATRITDAGGEAASDLLSVLVHEIGHFYGLTHTALNNVAPDLSDSDVSSLVESAVLSHSIGGVTRTIGVTPTMYPRIFDVVNLDGIRVGGNQDLAPDDISGMAWLYPRGSQDLFFSLKGEARTRTNPGTGLPSAPIPNSHVVAWADVDNDETTPRVAVFSTLSALYVNSSIYPEREGRFEIPHLWKTMETESGVFNANYTFSNSALNGSGYARQAPPGDLTTVEAIDSIEPATVLSNLAFTSEVLHEGGNVLDISNKDAGTPFVWDFQRRTLVSTDTERTMASIVGDNPMFGDPNDVCLFNVISSAKSGSDSLGVAGVVNGATTVRSIRDGLLMESALGTFVVDTYYKISPTAARYILGNTVAYSVTVWAVSALYWCLDHLLVLATALGFGVWMIRRRRQKLVRAATALALVAGLFIGLPASALLIYQTTDDLVASATDIVSGEITSVVSRQETTGANIYTDIVIEVSNTAKGTLNKQSTITLSQLGGRVGGLVSDVSEFAKFKTGETVILYLEYVEGFGYRVSNGSGGKIVVSRSQTGSKTTETVQVPDDLRESLQKSLPAGQEAPETMPLSDYMATLRSIARAQATSNN